MEKLRFETKKAYEKGENTSTLMKSTLIWRIESNWLTKNKSNNPHLPQEAKQNKNVLNRFDRRETAARAC